MIVFFVVFSLSVFYFYLSNSDNGTWRYFYWQIYLPGNSVVLDMSTNSIKLLPLKSRQRQQWPVDQFGCGCRIVPLCGHEQPGLLLWFGVIRLIMQLHLILNLPGCAKQGYRLLQWHEISQRHNGYPRPYGQKPCGTGWTPRRWCVAQFYCSRIRSNGR